jgi:hypothetical protein
MQNNERVLLVGSGQAALFREARRVTEEGGEVTVVNSVAAARNVHGSFDRGVFTFDLPDGSGVVLAAELILETRVRDVRFLHPSEERMMHDGREHGVRKASSNREEEERAQSVA